LAVRRFLIKTRQLKQLANYQFKGNRSGFHRF